MRVERWERERDYLIEEEEKMGEKVKVKQDEGKEEKKVKKVEKMIQKGVDEIVIVKMN